MGAICSCRCCGCSKAKPIPPQPKPEPKPERKPEIVIEPKPEPKREPEPIVEQKPEPEPIIEKVEVVDLLPPEIVKPVDVDKQDSISQPDQDEQEFDKALTTILDKSRVFQDNKKEIENQLSALFKQDQNKLRDCSENQDFCGPSIANRNICDIQNKYDFSQVLEFKEYRGNITIVRLIQKQKSPICTYLGKIEDKYCCVKLLPMVKKDDIKKWIERVYQVQKQPDAMIETFGQKYHFYKIEEVKNEQEYCNCYIISNLEQYNAYTFSHHLSITLADKVRIAYQAIQVISLALKTKIQEDKSSSLTERLSVEISKKLLTVKRNNILISRDKNNNGKYKLLLSDWQLLLNEFEIIIPYKKLQNEDKNYEKCLSLFLSVSGNIRSAALAQEEQEFNKNMQELDMFTKNVLYLIFFRINFELFDDVELKGFINEKKFKNIKENIKKIQGQAKEEYEQLKNQIKLRYAQSDNQVENQDRLEKKEENKEQMINIQSQLPQLICQEFGLNNSVENNLLYKIYIFLEVLKSEAMRPPLKEIENEHQLR